VLNSIQVTNLSGGNLFCAANSSPSAPMSPQLAKAPTLALSGGYLASAEGDAGGVMYEYAK
jgi:hypothetical protein